MIAEVVRSRHDNVKRTIERLTERRVIVQPPLEDEPETDAMGRTRVTQVYRLGKLDSITVVAQLSPEFTAARAWADEVDGKMAAQKLAQEQHALLEQQQPHVEYSQALLATSEVLDMATMAQKLTQAGYNIGRNRLFVLLREDRILKMDGTPYRYYAHRFYLNTSLYIDANGVEHAKHTVHVTAQGEAALLRKYAPKRTAFIAKANPPKRGLFKPCVATDESRTIAH
nr:phage antirepressor KilAC domain-containing protein [Burkholderia latens]